MTTENADVTIVSVCYNSSAVIEHMLASVPKHVPVILVDNGSEDVEAIKTIAGDYGALLIENRENCGYGKANNLAAKHADTEFLLFLNPDASLEAGALDALIAAARAYPKACAFNPAIINSSGQPYFKRSSSLLPKQKWNEIGWPDKDAAVSVLTGAALFVRRSAFEKIGGFDPAIFLYHEDDDLSLRLQKECGELMFVRNALVRHTNGRSSARSVEIATLKGWHMGRSRVYTARKHGQDFAFSKALASASIRVLSPTCLFSKRKRAKQIAFLKGIWSERRSSGPERKW